MDTGTVTDSQQTNGHGEWIERFYWSSPADVLALTNGRTRPIPRQIPDTIRDLAGTPLVSTQNVMIQVRDEAGHLVGIETELEILPSTSSGDQQLVVYVTVMIPGRGCLFAHELKRYGDPQRSAIYADVVRTGQPWVGELAVTATTGPRPDACGIVVGGTDEFSGVSGKMFQVSTMRRLAIDDWHNDVCETFCLVRGSG
jgi:hypothetical protein